MLFCNFIIGQEVNNRIKINENGLSPLPSNDLPLKISLDSTTKVLVSYKIVEIAPPYNNIKNKQHTYHPPKKALNLSEYNSLTNNDTRIKKENNDN